MNMMVAILLYLGVASSPQEVTSEMISKHSDAVTFYSNDPAFLNYYMKNYAEYTSSASEYQRYEDTKTGTSANGMYTNGSTTVVLTDWQEGD